MKSTTLVLLAMLHLAQGNVRGGDSRIEMLSIAHTADHGHRELGLIDSFCKFIGNFLPGRSTCTCSAESLVIDYECEFNKQVCTNGDEALFCTTPTVIGDLNIFKFKFAAEVCTSETLQGGVAVPGLCFNFGGNLFRGLFGGFNSPILEDSVKSEGDLESCTVQIGEETCYACEICDNGLGYRFDCSEFDESMVQTQCVDVHDFEDGSFLPILD